MVSSQNIHKLKILKRLKYLLILETSFNELLSGEDTVPVGVQSGEDHVDLLHQHADVHLSAGQRRGEHGHSCSSKQ